jgi:hypothetical protein
MTTQKRTFWKSTLYFAGVILAIFIGFHLFNHLLSLGGPDLHLFWMERFRTVYRHPVIETTLPAAVATQLVSGIRLLIRRKAKIPAEKTTSCRSHRYRYTSGRYTTLKHAYGHVIRNSRCGECWLPC